MVLVSTVVLMLGLFCSTPKAFAGERWTERFDLFGYADVVLGDNRYNSDTIGFDAYHFTTNMNIKVSDRWRVFTDVTYEHGTLHEEKNNVGELKTRYQIEGIAGNRLSAKVGRFLTPFGEMNTYHDASPTYLSVVSPQSIYGKRNIGKDADGKDISDRVFAKEAAGVWLLGHVPVSEWLVLYNVYATNGRGAGNMFKVDDNNNKGVGEKIELDTSLGLKLGTSLYYEFDGRSASWILPIGLHALYEWRDANLQSELVRTTFRKSGGSGYENDALAWYAQASYRIRWVTPFYRYESFDDNERWNPHERTHVAGVNLMLDPRVYLKLEYNALRKTDDVVQGQLSVAF